MVLKDLSIIECVVEVRNKTHLPFRTVAEIVNEELDLKDDDALTKDAAQKLYRRHYSAPSNDPSQYVATTAGQYDTQTVNNIIVQTIPEYPDERERDEPTSTLTDEYRAYFGDTWKATEQAEEPISPVHGRRVIALGDLHGLPHPTLIGRIVNWQPDIIIIGGDLLDAGQANPHAKFPHEKGGDPYRDEAARVRACLQTFLDKTTAKIFVMRGNHDDRWYKRAAEVLPEYLLEFFRDPLELLVYGLGSRVEMVKTQWIVEQPDGALSDLGQSAYMMTLGDALFSHGDFSGTNGGDAVRKLHTWVGKWRKSLNMDPSVYVQFHCHQQSMTAFDGGHVLLVEPGMAADPAAETYKIGYTLKWKGGIVGAVCMYQEYTNGEWITDKNSVFVIRP